MKNLRNIEHLVFKEPGGLRPSACAWDVSTDSLICAFGPAKDDALVQLKRWQHLDQPGGEAEVDSIASWDSPCPTPDLDCDSILSLKYFPDTSTSCLVLAGGDIVVVRETPIDGEDKIEIVGSVDAGISSASWSPDEELLAIATKENTLLYMTREFESVASTHFTPEDLDVSKHVDVGWGKSETQFKGKGAKALRDPTMPEKVDEGVLSSYDDHSCTITWRGDGSFAAVNSLQAGTRRVIRIYTRAGVLDGVSEPVDNLESTLSWRPSGNLLAGIQRLDGRTDVVFFERNGLRHGQFSLRTTKAEMLDWGTHVSLHWNSDSSVLAVKFHDRVQLWTMGNYHYYLKQEVEFPSDVTLERHIFSWHPEQQLVFATGSASFHRLEYISTISRGSTINPIDNGVVAVIDGQSLLLTPFRRANVPPPMALHSVKVDSNIVDVAFSEVSDCSLKVAVLTRDNICLFVWDASKIASEPVLEYSYLLSPSSSHQGTAGVNTLQQIVFTESKRLLLLASDGRKSAITLYGVTTTGLALKERYEHSQIQQITVGSVGSSCVPYLGLRGGQVVLADHFMLDTSNTSMSKTLPSIPGPINHTEIICLKSSYSGTTRSADDSSDFSGIVAVSLTRRGSLFAGERCLTTNCTSFLTTRAHLIFTTSQHLLKFVHISSSVEDLEVPPDTPEADERCRSIERGARLITAIPFNSALILQMPRGNLETIFPRALVLAEVRSDLGMGKFRKAFMSCRSHRVDMNILHDHDPQMFLSNVSNFLAQIKKPEYIDLFLSQVRNVDVSTTMYQETNKRPLGNNADHVEVSSKQEPAGIQKVNRICDAFLRAFRSDSRTNVQNIITAHCCKVPPDLESGLLEVHKLKIQSSEEAEKAIEHVCFLADVNRLYDTALGLYDLDLALLVAQQSQKDPREYLPFLQTLLALPMLRMAFAIDNHLGRYVKCLKHLQNLEVFEEVKSFAIEHSLYEDALLIYRYQEANIRELTNIYADYLLKKSRYGEAGIAFEYNNDYAAASEAYRLAHLWQESLSCASLVPLEKGQLAELALAIADGLVELKNYHAAATIHLDYLDSVETAAQLFCKGYYFADAIRVIALQAYPDLLESVVDAGLVEGMATTIELLAECRAQLGAQVPRIRELRTKKLEEPLAFFDADDNGGANIPDNVSLAGTEASTAGGSLFTRYTSRTGTVASNATRQTSKNRRKEERKQARGKKGSVYEEEYLVNSVGRLFERINSINEEVSRLVMGLVRRGMRERANAVQAAMILSIGTCNDCTEAVFQTPSAPVQLTRTMLNAELQDPQQNGGESVGIRDVRPEFLSQRRLAPVIKAFSKVSLLGG